MSSLHFERPTYNYRSALSLSEIKELYAHCETKQDRALLGIFYGCGLRRSEGEALNLRDVHFRQNLLYVRSGKFGKRRAVPMSEQVKEDLWTYVIEERQAKPGETAFLCNRSWKRLKGQDCNLHLQALAKRSNLNGHISLHTLRHSIATHLLQSGLPVEYVRDFLGHKHLEATQIYTTIRNEDLWNLKRT